MSCVVILLEGLFAPRIFWESVVSVCSSKSFLSFLPFCSLFFFSHPAPLCFILLLLTHCMCLMQFYFIVFERVFLILPLTPCTYGLLTHCTHPARSPTGWPEINEAMITPIQAASDRPDIVVRVFNLKRKHPRQRSLRQRLGRQTTATRYRVIEVRIRNTHTHLQ